MAKGLCKWFRTVACIHLSLCVCLVANNAYMDWHVKIFLVTKIFFIIAAECCLFLFFFLLGEVQLDVVI